MNNYKPFIVAGIVIVITGLLYVTATALLENRIRNELHSLQIGSFKTTSGKVEINLLRRQLTVHDAALEDTDAGHIISVPVTKARGIHIFQMLFNKELIINRLILQKPQFVLNNRSSDDKSTPLTETGSGPTGEIKPVILKNVEIQDAKVLLQSREENDTILYTAAGLEAWNLHFGNASERIRFTGHSAERIRIILDNIVYVVPGGLYRLKTGAVSFDTQEAALNVDSLHLSSLHSKYETARQKGVETDWYNIKLKQIKVLGIKSNALAADSSIVFRKATLDNMDAHIFRDKRLPFPDKPDTRLPMAMLENLPLKFHSDSILITGSRVLYEEHAEESTETGMVSFDDLYASVYNLSNLADSIKGPTAMSARAMVMNESLLEAEFTFPNHIHSHKYTVTGSLSPVNFSVFNPIVEPSAFVQIDDGQLKSLEFNFEYDNDQSDGKLKMQYENLSITLLDQEDASEKKLKTFLTETFVLKQNNDEEQSLYQEGTISFERDKKRSVFNYWWKSLFSGIQDILAF